MKLPFSYIEEGRIYQIRIESFNRRGDISSNFTARIHD